MDLDSAVPADSFGGRLGVKSDGFQMRGLHTATRGFPNLNGDTFRVLYAVK